ncbi:MAG: HAD family hydrolase [Lachnospiraceae bacterium]|nr:HAD family hydrolase [Lachnospiraceae bacterium]
MIKLIASDLDGTLIPEGTQEIEPGFMEVLEELLDRGYLFYAASGRQYANMRLVFTDYTDRIGFVCENGSLAMEKEELQYIQEIPREKALEIARDIMSFPEADICVSCAKACYIQPRTKWYEDQIVQVLKNETVIFGNLEEIDDKIIKLAMYVYDFSENAERIRDFLQEKYGDYADFVFSGNGWVDMLLKNAGKGLALRTILEQKGLQPEELMVFGDNQNDISMLELTPNSYAMAHAKPDVQAHAAHTCVSVTAFLREFLKTGL